MNSTVVSNVALAIHAYEGELYFYFNEVHVVRLGGGGTRTNVRTMVTDEWTCMAILPDNDHDDDEI